MLQDSGDIPDLGLSIAVSPRYDFRRRLSEVQQLEAAIAAERALLNDIDDLDMRARAEMNGPLSGLLADLEVAQRKLDEARSRYADAIGSTPPIPTNRGLRLGAGGTVTTTPETGGGRGTPAVVDEDAAKIFERLRKAMEEAQFELNLTRAGYDELGEAGARALHSIGVMTDNLEVPDEFAEFVGQLEREPTCDRGAQAGGQGDRRQYDGGRAVCAGGRAAEHAAAGADRADR